MPWIYGWNRPGYLPDCEPVACGTWEEARDALAWEVERWDEESLVGLTSETLDAAAAAIQASTPDDPVTVPCGSYVLWVSRDDAQ